MLQYSPYRVGLCSPIKPGIVLPVGQSFSLPAYELILGFTHVFGM